MKINSIKVGWFILGWNLVLIQSFFIVAPSFALFGCAARNRPSDIASASASIGGYEAKFVNVNGARTRYYDVGRGEVILLVHGARPSGTSSANT